MPANYFLLRDNPYARALNIVESHMARATYEHHTRGITREYPPDPIYEGALFRGQPGVDLTAKGELKHEWWLTEALGKIVLPWRMPHK